MQRLFEGDACRPQFVRRLFVLTAASWQGRL